MRAATAVAVLLIPLLAGCASPGPEADDEPLARMLVRVQTVASTPPEDDVQMEFANGTSLALRRISASWWETWVDARHAEDGRLVYRYIRNGWNASGEQVPLLDQEPLDALGAGASTNGSDGASGPTSAPASDGTGTGGVAGTVQADDARGRHGGRAGWRSMPFVAGGVHVDQIEAWTWLTVDPVSGQVAGEAGVVMRPPNGTWVPRAGDRSFRSGQAMQVPHHHAFDAYVDETAAHLRARGYGWVLMVAEWNTHVTTEGDLTPVQFLDSLRRQVMAYKEQGLQVMLEPRITQAPPPQPHAPATDWDAWFQRLSDFLVANAALAQDTRVDALVHDASAAAGAPTARARWTQLWDRVATTYKGEIGEIVHLSDASGGPAATPARTFAGDHLDLVVVQTDMPLTTAHAPTPGMLESGARRIVKAAADVAPEGVPTFLVTSYLDVAATWKGGPFYATGSMPTLTDPASTWDAHVRDESAQARVVDAFFHALADEPAITGYAQSGYWHWDMPLLPDASVRNQAAEEQWQAWNTHIASEEARHEQERQQEERRRQAEARNTTRDA